MQGKPVTAAGDVGAGVEAAAAGGGRAAAKKRGALKSVLEGLEELWDENQYAEEFSLDTFINKLAPR